MITLYCRFLLSTSIIIHNISFNFLKTYDLPKTETSAKNVNNSTTNYSLFQFKTTHIHNHTKAASNASSFRFIGLGIGFCTICIGGYAAYQSRIQSVAALDSLEALKINNEEMRRQNDLEEVSQGLMSREYSIKN